jgi:RHH-type proline utilization regulon transcriptional repressor/proline dehydrogenase/delta 1-pyrroline-5-carboxylate dehydrogenase
VPDATQDRLIRDKLAEPDWERHLGHSRSPFVNASTWALMLTGRIVEGDVSRWISTPSGGLQLGSGEPVIRQAVDQSGQAPRAALRAGTHDRGALENPARRRVARSPFDMLGEAAMTRADAKRY